MWAGIDPFQSRLHLTSFTIGTRRGLGTFLWTLAKAAWSRFAPKRIP